MIMLLAAETLDGYYVLLLLGVMILVGMFAGRFIEKYNIPNITGYLLLGVVFGGLLIFIGYTNFVENFSVVMSVALGFIVFSIGMELDIKKLTRRRNEIIVITIIQALAAFLFTALGVFIFRIPLHIALLFGAIAIATEPGPILLITKKYRTKGPLTDTLIPLHGIEDAFAIIVFGIVLSYAVSVYQGQSLAFLDILYGPIFELLFSIIVAVIIGVIFKTIIKYLEYEDPEKDQVVYVTALVAVLISVAVANIGLHIYGLHVHLSPILVPMGVGIVFANMSSRKAKHETENIVDQFSPPIMIAFFTIIGAEIVMILHQELGTLGGTFVFVIALVYILFRVLGKLVGSWMGATIMRSDKGVRKYLGLCLLPQAQAAIGLAFYARRQLDYSYYGNLILVVVLIATFVYEIFGPFGVKLSLSRCKESDMYGNCIVSEK